MAKKEVFVNTVYVAMPSLYDTELIPTVLNLFEEASDPKNIYVGVSLLDLNDKLANQFVEATKKYSDNIRFEYIEVNDNNYREMLGVGFGRRRVLDLYGGEDYILQTDSHAMVAKNWDTTLITKFHEAQDFVKNKKVILTAYAGSYSFTEDGKRTFLQTDPHANDYYSRLQFVYFSTGTKYYNVIPRWDILPEYMLDDFSGPFVPALKFNANFTFSDKEFAHNSGLYDDACFFEEEIIQTVNLVKLGYTLVYPVLDDPVVAHMYTDLWVGDHGFRTSLSDIWPEYQVEMANRCVRQYKEYFATPENKEASKEYGKYARMHPLHGTMYKNPYIPDYFINSEVKYGRKA